MARLFITPRELNFVSDIAKEITKDVNGQVIVYYAISHLKTKSHDVYNEALDKVFDNPVSIDAFVSAEFQGETKIDSFGIDAKYKIEAFVQYRDMVEKGIEVSVGDYFSFSDIFYEITSVVTVKNIWGQAEHRQGLKIIGTKARDGQFKTKLVGPTDIKYTDEGAVQKEFVQQRGFVENSNGPTGDRRDLHQVTDEPITGPKEVSERGALSDSSHHGSAFYDDEE